MRSGELIAMLAKEEMHTPFWELEVDQGIERLLSALQDVSECFDVRDLRSQIEFVLRHKTRLTQPQPDYSEVPF